MSPVARFSIHYHPLVAIENQTGNERILSCRHLRTDPAEILTTLNVVLDPPLKVRFQGLSSKFVFTSSSTNSSSTRCSPTDPKMISSTARLSSRDFPFTGRGRRIW